LNTCLTSSVEGRPADCPLPIVIAIPLRLMMYQLPLGMAARPAMSTGTNDPSGNGPDIATINAS
jgi:hypothetical protein